MKRLNFDLAIVGIPWLNLWAREVGADEPDCPCCPNCTPIPVAMGSSTPRSIMKRKLSICSGVAGCAANTVKFDGICLVLCGICVASWTQLHKRCQPGMTHCLFSQTWISLHSLAIIYLSDIPPPKLVIRGLVLSRETCS